ncbi:THO complex subunit 4A isoform X2 [Amborella trichopoda]|uniref:THO complex subunit 4A isoform X2 n=1 Tax=Amborella trichopoda TaxID=13333 RepID=UPI0005D3B3B8|nr:THO complex subunit 4A isoform X2 [Amborella trichopoda]|eukprot:XP_011624054.1 THO complex subunit 4A isoform X2 [Amborella trichopoda]
MSSALDMSLDDLIKNNKKSGGGGGGGVMRGRNRGGTSGPVRRIQNRTANRAAPYSMGKAAPETTWQHDLFADPVGPYGVQAARPSAIETGTKLYISNLDYGVSNEDIKELFSEVGDLKRYSIHYDRSGRSKGTAEVVFSRRADAVAAVKRYNNVQLDGKPMKIEIVGTNLVTPAPIPQVANGLLATPNGIPRSVQPRGAGIIGRGPRGGGRGGGRGRGRGGRGGGRGEKVSAADLDADLEKYHSEAMQIN